MLLQDGLGPGIGRRASTGAAVPIRCDAEARTGAKTSGYLRKCRWASMKSRWT